MSERNKEYYDLKARIEKWAIWVSLIYPLFGGIILVFGGMWATHKILPGAWAGLGFFIGAFLWQGIGLYLCKSKVGFLMYSKETCQNCGIAMARWNGMWFALDYMCRECGNNNSVSLIP